jgi:hypothetical protein
MMKAQTLQLRMQLATIILARLTGFLHIGTLGVESYNHNSAHHICIGARFVAPIADCAGASKA